MPRFLSPEKYVLIQSVFTRYSTVSKRVNVKNLKSDIWGWIEESCPDRAAADVSENKNPNSNDVVDKKRRSMEKIEPASFQTMISNVAVDQQHEKGQEVSVSYYFICLLHLANEKVDSMHFCLSSLLLVI